MKRQEIGQMLATLRKSRGLTLRKVEEKTGVGFSYLSKIEKGEQNASLDILLKILDALDGEITIHPRQ